jgi:hypothetical protein
VLFTDEQDLAEKRPRNRKGGPPEKFMRVEFPDLQCVNRLVAHSNNLHSLAATGKRIIHGGLVCMEIFINSLGRSLVDTGNVLQFRERGLTDTLHRPQRG